MKRHLDKQKKCIINDTQLSEYELYNESLIRKTITDNFEILVKKYDNEKKHFCEKCNKDFTNKSNLNKHIKSKSCIEEIKENPIIQNINNNNHNNNVQNIGVQNNFIFNINSLRGFDEDWNISAITKDMREKILLSDKKFTNTLENILKNDDNLNVILKDKATGIVYKTKNNDYEIMPVKNILEESMDKIYKHLRDFFTEVINNNKNDIRIDILENELKEVDKKYNNYKNSIMINDNVNSCLSNIFDEKKIESLDKFYEINNDNKDDNNYKIIASEY